MFWRCLICICSFGILWMFLSSIQGRYVCSNTETDSLLIDLLIDFH